MSQSDKEILEEIRQVFGESGIFSLRRTSNKDAHKFIESLTSTVSLLSTVSKALREIQMVLPVESDLRQDISELLKNPSLRCSNCSGTGHIRVQHGFFTKTVACPECYS